MSTRKRGNPNWVWKGRGLQHGQMYCKVHQVVVSGGTCARCTNKPPQRPIRDVAADVVPIPDSVPAESPYDG